MISPDVLARVSFLPTDRGGRTQATPSGHLGCICVIDDGNFDCRLLLSNTGPIWPGETKVVPIKFLYIERVKSRLTEGKHFLLRELAVVATGEIIQIF